MKPETQREYWRVSRALPFTIFGRPGTFHFVQERHFLYLEHDETEVTVVCCDSGVTDFGSPPPEECVVRRLGGFTVESGKAVRVIRGKAMIEGVCCDIELLITKDSGRLYGSIERHKKPSGDDDATGVWTAEDPGGGLGDGRDGARCEW